MAGVPQEGVSADQQLDAAAQVARDEIVPALLGIDGVATVDLTGGLETQAVVTLDPAKLTETGISVAQVTGILAANNLTVPTGQISTDGTNIPVSTIGSITSLDQIENLVVGVKTPATAPTIPGTTRRHRPPAPPRPSPSRPRRSSSRTSPPSRKQASRRPATPARTACRR